jgi:uncharacterized damage-inducible protein DinB
MSEDHRADAAAVERDALLFFLNRVRASVVRTSQGLSENEQRVPGVPSGTNLLGLVRHLTAMEVHWFQSVFLGEDHDIDGSMRVPVASSRDDVVTAYREACARSDQIVADCRDLSTLSSGNARSPGSSSKGKDNKVPLRRIVAHMIEETARHAGHADILREQIDGSTDL